MEKNNKPMKVEAETTDTVGENGEKVQNIEIVIDELKTPQTKTLPLASIKPYWRNAKMSNNVEDLKESIAKYGYNQYILVDNNHVIIAGHSRYKALMQLGYTEVPVHVLNISEAKAKKLRILDNKIAESNLWDSEKLSVELREIGDIELSQFCGISLSDEIKLNVEPHTAESIEAAKENLKEVTAQRGEKAQQEVICPHCGDVFYI